MPTQHIHTEGIAMSMAEHDAHEAAEHSEAWWTLDHALKSAKVLSEVGSLREVVRRRVAYGPWAPL